MQLCSGFFIVLLAIGIIIETFTILLYTLPLMIIKAITNKEKEQKELDKYRPDIEGKFLKKINRSWRGPITVPNPKDFEIVYVKKIDFVGHGFIRCKTVVFNVVYSGFEKAIDKSNYTGTNFDGVEVSSWEDDQYDFSFEYLKDPVIMTKEMAQKEIDKAIACANSQKIAFWEYIRKN